MRYLHFVVFLLVVACNLTSEKKISIEKQQTLFVRHDSTATGIDFVNHLPLNERINVFTYEYYYNGGGVSIGDINNDGLEDIYFTSNLGDNKLYLNKGNLKFEDITSSSGASGKSGWATGTTMVDINNDGLLDIYVCRSGRFAPESRKNELFINNGNLTFTESAKEYGIDDAAYSTQALFFDYDKDNDLDMYLLNHSIEVFQGRYIQEWMNGVSEESGDKLYRNDDGKYIDVSKEAGINQSPLGYGLGIAAGDLNNDGWVDLYVTNDYVEHDYLYINNGDGTFSDDLKSAIPHTSNFSMGVDIADINNDGLDDIGVLDMVAEDNYRQKTNMASMNPEQFYVAVKNGFHYQYMFNTLQLNRGNGKFSDIAQLAGISNTDWSWTYLAQDFNNDSWNDILITNGFRKEFGNKDFVKYRKKQIDEAMNASREERLNVLRDLLSKLKDGKLQNYIFENNKDLTFSKRNEDWGLDELTFSNGASVADLDNDGDLDIVINNIDQEAFVYENQLSNSNYLTVKLNGPETNKSGIGARVIISDLKQTIEKSLYTTRGYQSSLPTKVHFGLGEMSNVKLKVVWSDGKTQELSNLDLNQTLEIDYQPFGQNVVKESSKIFTDITKKSNLDFIHQENDYDDYANQVLLPHKMSQFGPAMSVGDVNSDGLEDIYFGGAAGFSGKLYFQNTNGTFSQSDQNIFNKHKNKEEVGALFFDADSDGDLDLYIANGGNEFNSKSDMLLDNLYLNDGQGGFSDNSNLLPKLKISGQTVSANDVDGDGDLDLFVGGRLIYATYPFPASSALLINNGKGEFVDKTDELAPELNNLGMITSANWVDINSDGVLELALAGEWTSVMIFENSNGKGKLKLMKNEGLSQFVGWWYSLNADDIDGDGDTDLIVGNLGNNYKYKATAEEPFKVYADDFDGNGSSDIVLGYYNDGSLYPLRGRQCSSEQIPGIKKKFESYHDFGLATLTNVYGENNLESALSYSATTFSSGIFYNDGEGNFKFEPLPNMAQLSSVNGICVLDYNGDSIKDIVVAGNLFTSEIETTRNDASYGLLLKGTKDGKFIPVDLGESGLSLGGDVKSISLINLMNGELGIVAAVNDSKAKLVIKN